MKKTTATVSDRLRPSTIIPVLTISSQLKPDAQEVIATRGVCVFSCGRSVRRWVEHGAVGRLGIFAQGILGQQSCNGDHWRMHISWNWTSTCICISVYVYIYISLYIHNHSLSLYVCMCTIYSILMYAYFFFKTWNPWIVNFLATRLLENLSILQRLLQVESTQGFTTSHAYPPQLQPSWHSMTFPAGLQGTMLALLCA